MLEHSWTKPNEIFSSDSCLTGGGALTNTEFIQWQYPDEILELKCNINRLECMMVVVALKLLGGKLERKKLVIHCDNQVSVLAINSDTSRDIRIQSCLRELHKVMAQKHCDLKAIFIRGDSNHESDALSRWGLSKKFHETFYNLTKQLKLKS